MNQFSVSQTNRVQSCPVSFPLTSPRFRTIRPMLTPSTLSGSSRSPFVPSRKAFTLIELLVVIAIIAILASLLTVGVQRAIQFSRQVGVKTEMAQIELALANAARELGSVPYIPSVIILKDDLSYDTTIPVEAASQRLLQMMFPGLSAPVDWNANGSVDGATLTADQAWVFFLGGIPYASGPDGFNRNPANPTVALGKRKGPFYDFKPTRLIKLPNGFYIYRDSWEAKSGIGMIVYNNISRDPAAFDLDRPSTLYPGRYLQAGNKLYNPKGYQIISAGKDGVFGVNQTRPVLFNGYTDADTTGGADDQANFAESVLAKPVD